MFMLRKCFERLDRMIGRVCFHDVTARPGVEDIVNQSFCLVL